MGEEGIKEKHCKSCSELCIDSFDCFYCFLDDRFGQKKEENIFGFVIQLSAIRRRIRSAKPEFCFANNPGGNSTVYGIFHTALCDLVRNNFDASLWQQVINRSGLGEDHFLRAKDYDDEISFQLFNTAAAVLDISLNQLFEKLGLHFITDSAAHLIDTLTMGSRPGFEHSILGIHEMVATLSKTMPGFSMGRFPAESLGDGRYRLEYVSARSGMVPFVRGMIFGIANLYAKRITVETYPEVYSSTEHGAVFLITERVGE